MTRKKAFTRSVRERQEIRAELSSTRAALQDAEQEIVELKQTYAKNYRRWLWADVAVLVAVIVLVVVF